MKLKHMKLSELNPNKHPLEACKKKPREIGKHSIGIVPVSQVTRAPQQVPTLPLNQQIVLVMGFQLEFSYISNKF